jgi:hypothetical protein
MATKIQIKGDGTVVAVYDDRFREILEAIGTMSVKRASEVEFDEATGEWVATLKDGTEVGRGKNRNEVIAAEVAYLEARL